MLMQLSWEEIELFLNKYEALGPMPGILAAMIEAFLPILPLIAIIIANVNAYNLWEGILFSWIGVFCGSISVFWLVRRFGYRFRSFIDRKWQRSHKLTHWLEHKGFMPVFLLACFPFTPSFFVNLIAGISKMPMRVFVVATALGKAIMILLVSLVGYDLGALFKQPWRLALVALLFIFLVVVGRKIEAKYLKD
jgi:uncharacterized membrane protein YdjX (TVP38/TMEM64 family)